MNKHKNLTVNVVCLPDCEKEIKLMFFNILDDYCKRFKVTVVDRKTTINICLVEYDEDTESEGLMTATLMGDKILIQLRDPFMNDWEANPYTVFSFLCVLSHEMIHACQFLTNRKGFKIPNLVWDKKDPKEQYYFDPMEVEARVLETPYAQLYGHL